MLFYFSDSFYNLELCYFWDLSIFDGEETCWDPLDLKLFYLSISLSFGFYFSGIAFLLALLIADLLSSYFWNLELLASDLLSINSFAFEAAS